MDKAGIRVCRYRFSRWINDNGLIVKEAKATEHGVNLHMNNGTILSVYRRLSDGGPNSMVTIVLGGKYSEDIASSLRQLAQLPVRLVNEENFDGMW